MTVGRPCENPLDVAKLLEDLRKLGVPLARLPEVPVECLDVLRPDSRRIPRLSIHMSLFIGYDRNDGEYVNPIAAAIVKNASFLRGGRSNQATTSSLCYLPFLSVSIIGQKPMPLRKASKTRLLKSKDESSFQIKRVVEALWHSAR